MSFAFDETKYRNQYNSSWTADMDAVLRQGRTAGKSDVQIASEISARFGISHTPQSIGNRAFRLNLPNRNSPWTTEVTMAMLEKRNIGKSAATIANELNAEFSASFTRNAIIGRCGRMKLPPRAVVITLNGRSARTPSMEGRRPRIRSEVVRAAKGLRPIKFRPPPQLIIDLEIPLAQRKTLMELGPRDCRHGVHDVGQPEFFFCGGPVREGQSYCEAHCQRNFYRRMR
jgi:GcrA cell cycle regulator